MTSEFEIQGKKRIRLKGGGGARSRRVKIGSLWKASPALERETAQMGGKGTRHQERKRSSVRSRGIWMKAPLKETKKRRWNQEKKRVYVKKEVRGARTLTYRLGDEWRSHWSNRTTDKESQRPSGESSSFAGALKMNEGGSLYAKGGH